jgi:hypothetical protein
LVQPEFTFMNNHWSHSMSFSRKDNKCKNIGCKNIN